MTSPVSQRARSYAVFERRYQPIVNANSELIRDWRDLPSDVDEHFVWTVVDAEGRLYLVPGFATVNYFGRVLCRQPWPEEEQRKAGYVY